MAIKIGKVRHLLRVFGLETKDDNQAKGEPASYDAGSSLPRHRKMVVVAHDLGNDQKYMKKCGYDPFEKGIVDMVLDTYKLADELNRTHGMSLPLGLGGLVHEYNIADTEWVEYKKKEKLEFKNQHLAANDAMRTLEVLLAILIDMSGHDVNKPVPFRMQDVIIHSIDFESWEHGAKDANNVTEMGSVLLDCRSLQYLPPGPRGLQWLSLTRSSQYRVREFADKKFNNKTFCGSSEISDFCDKTLVAKAEMGARIQQLFSVVDFKSITPVPLLELPPASHEAGGKPDVAASTSTPEPASSAFTSDLPPLPLKPASHEAGDKPEVVESASPTDLSNLRLEPASDEAGEEDEGYTDLIRLTCPDNLSGKSCKAKACQNSTRLFHICLDFRVSSSNPQESCHLCHFTDLLQNGSCTHTSLMHNGVVHLTRTCPSILKQRPCTMPETCQFAHDHADIRLSSIEYRKLVAKQNVALQNQEHREAVRRKAEKEQAHEQRMAAQKQSRTERERGEADRAHPQPHGQDRKRR